MINRVAIVLLFGILLLALPESALACPVCFDSSAENRLAFMQTAAALTLLPLGMIAGLGAWIRRRSRDKSAVDAEREQDSAE
jgi:hypothetical protein